MTTLDDRLYDLSEALAVPPLPGAPAVMQRGRQRRHRRRARLAAGALLVGTGTGIAGSRVLGGSDPDVQTSIDPAADGGRVDSPSATSTVPMTTSTVPMTTSTVPVTTSTVPNTTTTVPATPGPTPTSTVPAGQLVAVPDLIGLTVGHARDALQDAGFLVRVAGNGSADATVVAQTPAAGARIAAGGEVRIEAS
jgi:hypothetical protein